MKLVVLLAVLPAAGLASDGASAQTGQTKTYSIYAGSRGNGVPSATLRRLADIESYLSKRSAERPDLLTFKKTIVGLEGELMICVELTQLHKHPEILDHLKLMTAAVPLLSLAAANCAAR